MKNIRKEINAVASTPPETLAVIKIRLHLPDLLHSAKALPDTVKAGLLARNVFAVLPAQAVDMG